VRCDNESCQPQPDGCGGLLMDCAPCCTPQTCGNKTCGLMPDGCGALLTCGPPCSGGPIVP
jgi:hypothetical protein